MLFILNQTFRIHSTISKIAPWIADPECDFSDPVYEVRTAFRSNSADYNSCFSITSPSCTSLHSTSKSLIPYRSGP